MSSSLNLPEDSASEPNNLVPPYFSKIIAICAIGIGLFHLLNVAGVLLLSTMEIRLVHLAVMMVILFLSQPFLTSKTNSIPSGNTKALVTGMLPAIIAVVIAVYFLSRWKAIALSGGDTSSLDLYFGIALLVMVLEATRRSIGNVLAAITLVFLVYPFVSPYLPGVLHGRGVSANRVANFLTTTNEGVYGIPLGVAATYIIIFSLFGAFLNQFGAGDFFFRLASKVTKGMLAASAKTAVIFSSLLGMISGSAAGNVAVTGSFTIPMMKREGYESRQAAAIEAVVSTGGQILPPVMGAAAFIMAEIVGTPYVNVMKAALIPALLFFTSIIFVVHLQAKKNGIARSSVTAEELDESLGKTLWNGIPFLIPFALLIGLMIQGYSPFKACFYAMFVLVVTYAIWNKEFGLGLIKKIADALQKGARSTVPISIACAAAGIISGNLAVSGLGIKISSIIISASGGIPIVALVLTMFTAIILGMGLPTTAAYLILATVVAPSLAELGVPLLTAHMFVFFFGCVSTITPPVALASYVAAGIANADINKVGWTAFGYGITAFVLPFMFFFGPALLLDGSPIEVALAVASGIAGVYLVAGSVVGYLNQALTMPFRVMVFTAGLLLLLQGVVTDIAGLAIYIGVMLGSSIIISSKG
jgi:TRAP transporter 4TM/12TM fusion protein